MKKHLFSAMSVFALFAYQVNAQTTTLTVKPNTDVKVTEGALLYVNGEMHVDNYTSNGKKVSNSGNIKITKKLTNAKADGTNFVNELDGTGKYGQLIVSNGSGNENTGKITSVLKFKEGFGAYPFAIPYKDITAEDVVRDLLKKGASEDLSNAFTAYNGNANYRRGFDQGRVPGNVLFYWDNDKYQFTQLNKTDKIGELGEEARYYAINTTAKAGSISLSNKTSIEGTPIKDNVTVTLKKYTTLKNHYKRPEDGSAEVLDGKNTGVNGYGEAYGSYITDFTVAMPQDWTNYFIEGEGVDAGDFGLRIYDIGNPYTSNIDLEKLLNSTSNVKFKSKVKALVQYGKQGYEAEINAYGSKMSGSYGGTTFSSLTKDGAGDDNLKIVAPFQTFAVKMTSDMDNTVTLTFNDDVKTFKGTGAEGTGAVFNTVFAKGGEKGAQINQVALDLLDENGDVTGLRTYVVASDIYEASQKGEGTEIYNPKLTEENTGIYTLQEKEDGSIDESLANNKAYINGVNADKYVGKPIHLVVQNGKGQYTLRTRLNEDLSKNKNAFYFEDKKTGKIAKVDKNFAYTFNANGTEKDRFVLYWAQTPKTNQVKDMVEDAVDATNIVKSGDNFLVLFSKEISNADVFVYNISGQLISAERNVNAKQPHTLYIKGNSSVYIVKVVVDNGKVITKKIIK